MQGWRLILIGAALALMGCGRGVSGTSAKPTTVPAKPAAGDAASASALITADESGIVERDLHGKVLRRLTATPAARPRRIAGTDQLLFLHKLTGALYRLDLGTGTETLVVALPHELACGPGETLEIETQSDDDFTLHRDGKHVCVTLLDRNMNMADALVEAEVDLTTGRMESRVRIEPEGCAIQRSEVALAHCHAGADDGRPQPDPPAPPPPIQPAVPSGFDPVDQSASGRWVLHTGDVSEGDYIHILVLLADRKTGAVHAIATRDDDVAWPAPLTAEQRALSGFEALYPVLGDIVAEDTVRWVGNGEILYLAGRLVIPGERIVRVGDLAP